MRLTPLLFSALAVATLAACSSGTEETHIAQQPETTSDVVGTSSKAIDGRYIVMLEPGQNLDILPSLLSKLGLKQLAGSLLTPLSIINGGLLKLTPEQAERLARMPGVASVEQDREVSINQVTQSGATWGLDRIDQAALPLDGLYTYPAHGGSAVNVYILDTGIRASHVDFGGRVVNGYNVVGSSPFDIPLLPLPIDLGALIGTLLPPLAPRIDPDNWNDCNGHGTHVAGTAAGSNWGVAKDASLYAVRVLGCSGSGSMAGIIAGVEWVVDNHVKPAVANMSLGGGSMDALDAAVRAAVDAGVVMVVAAGNDNANACNGSPNRVAEAITVGSSDNQDRRSSFSNFGSCVDLFAPGSDITSAWHTGDSNTSTISGTSMAAPHVAGAAALLLQDAPTATPAQIADALIGSGTAGVLSNIGSGSPNVLLHVAP